MTSASPCQKLHFPSRDIFYSKEHKSPNQDSAFAAKKIFHLTAEQNPSTLWKNHQTKANLYASAAKASIIFYMVLACAGCFFLGFLSNPLYLPAGVITAITMMGVPQAAHDFFLQKANLYYEMASEEKYAAEQVDFLDKQKYFDFETRLMMLEVPVLHLKNKFGVENFNKLKGLWGRYEYWKHNASLLKAESQRYKEEKATMPEVVQSLRLESFRKEESSYESQVKAAFYLFLLRHPNFQGDLGDICTLYMPSFEERQLGLVYGTEEKTQDSGIYKKTKDPFIVFNNKAYGEIGIAMLKSMSISDLANRIRDAALDK